MSIKKSLLRKILFTTISIVIIVVAVWQIKKIMFKPLYEIELSIVETSFAAFDSEFHSIALEKLTSVKSLSAKDSVNLGFAKYFASKGDFIKAIDYIKKIESSFNRQVALAYTLAYQYSFSNKTEASQAMARLLNDYGKALSYALVYIFTKDEFFFEKSTALAKNFNIGQKKVLAKALTKEFESKNLYLENLKYWSIVAPQNYDTYSADLSKTILIEDIPYFTEEIKNRLRLRDYTRQINLYREGKKSREETLKSFESLQERWFKQYPFFLNYEMPDIVAFYIELDDKQRAFDFIQRVFDLKKDYLKNNDAKSEVNINTIRSYAKLGAVDKALEIIDSDKDYNQKINYFNTLLRTLAESKDFENAFKIIELAESLDFRLNLIYNYPTIKQGTF